MQRQEDGLAKQEENSLEEAGAHMQAIRNGRPVTDPGLPRTSLAVKTWAALVPGKPATFFPSPSTLLGPFRDIKGAITRLSRRYLL